MTYMPKDLTGQRFGRLVAMEDTGERDKFRNRIWRCRCDCGNETLTTTNSLMRKNARSCGCLAKERTAANFSQPKDITGQRFGKLVALEWTGEKNARGTYLWRCICDCGNEKVTAVSCLTAGGTKSCGCLRHENRGKYKTERDG